MQNLSKRKNFIRYLQVLALTLALGLLVAFRAISSHADDARFGGADVREFITSLSKKDGFDKRYLEDVFARAVYKQNVIDAISRPAEAKPWKDYRPIFISRTRALQGAAFLREHREVLEKAEAQYGVPVEIIVAIMGVETRYGQNKGSFRVIDSLATLGFHYEPRADFFRKELREFLIMAREESRDPTTMLGSYAGAMGFPQFIPSSFRAYAVDFDGDGRRDFWTGPVDAIGSIGNYLGRHGWKAGEGIALRASVSDNSVDEIANPGLKPSHSFAELVAMGVGPIEGVDPDAPVSLLRLEGQYGNEYWIGLHNFHVIMTYNRSRLYAMAVYQLSREIINAL